MITISYLIAARLPLPQIHTIQRGAPFVPLPPLRGGGATPGRARPVTHDEARSKIPESTKHSLHYRLTDHARQRWPQIKAIDLRYRANLADVDAELTDGQSLPLCRLRYGGYANQWGFALYRASHDDYQENCLPTGHITGSAEEALDTACGLYLNDATAWINEPPTN